MESSQELPLVELHMLATVTTGFKLTITGTYLGKYGFLLELDQLPYKAPVRIGSRFEQLDQADARKEGLFSKEVSVNAILEKCLSIRRVNF